jgi:serine-type D-Ala-D-Ala carboxypeptidase/endopeptidase (penicillin-binding protein 4)
VDPGVPADLELRALLLLTALLLGGTLPATGQSVARQSPTAELAAELRTLLASRPGGGRHALLVVSLERGDTLVALDHHQALSPASNAKLYSTAAALHYLGPEFRFATYLLAAGEVVDGVLHGDLYLYGTGDPSLSDRLLPSGRRALAALTDTLHALGVREVSGSVIGDGSYFAESLRPLTWDPAHATARYAPSVGALSLGGNLELRPLPGRPQSAQQVPATDPALLGARALARVLAESGVRVRGGTRTLYAPDASPMAPGGGARPGVRVLAVHHSPSLRQLVRFTNHTSDNLTAEALLRTLGKVVTGDPSFESGARVVNVYMERVVGAEAVALVDGSGLSRSNRVSAAATVRLLAHMRAGEHWEDYRESLPAAGVPAGMRRMAGTAAADNARAKSGTLRDVSALSGYVRSADGELLAFSIIGNDLTSTAAAKQLENRVVVRLAGFRRGVASPAAALAR